MGKTPTNTPPISRLVIPTALAQGRPLGVQVLNASIVTLPGNNDIATPLALTNSGGYHCTEFVMLAVKPLLYVPVAVSCSESPIPTEGLAGVIAIDTSRGSVSSSPVCALTGPNEAEITVKLGNIPVARPVALIVAGIPYSGWALHSTEFVRFCVV